LAGLALVTMLGWDLWPTSAFLQGLLFGKLGRFCLFASRARLRGAAGVR
jgi:hypothetical protein